MTVVSEIHAGLASFNESFGSFLYGLKMNAASVEWTEAPVKESFERQRQREAEAELLQRQQEELDRIQERQRIEQEQEQERQRQELERQEAERIQAALAAQQAAASAASASASSSSKMRYRGGAGTGTGTGTGTALSKSRTAAAGVGGGAMRGKIPRPVSAASGPSRVGANGQVRKLAGKVVMKKMAERLPLKYRDEPHRSALEAIMRSLAEHSEGQYLPDLVAAVGMGVARHRCNEYLGVLVHAKEVVKTSNKGVLFSLNPDRYPRR
ncbi:DASH complex subunit dam1 [Podila epigama]|nr:DASH complex subunit dam1 [Podila epigama]